MRINYDDDRGEVLNYDDKSEMINVLMVKIITNNDRIKRR